MLELPKRTSIYIYASAESTHERRIIQGVSDFARIQNPPWSVRWGSFLTSELLHRSSFDGLIVIALSDRQRELVGKLKIPVVNVSSRNLPWQGSSVTPDNALIGKLAATHFLERLYRRFHFIGPDAHSYSVERFEGFKASVSPFTCEAFWLRDDDPGGPGAVSRQLGDYLNGLPTGTAVFTANDIFARRVCDCVQSISRQVPEDIAVLGVDADKMVSLASPVPVSSVDPDSTRIGFEAARLICGLLEGSRKAENVLIPPRGINVDISTDHLATNDPKIASAIQLIQQHACQGLTVSDVAQALAMGRRSIEQRFREATGRGIDEQIRRARLDRARELLDRSDLTISEIAEKTGYSNLYYFSSAFKKHFGASPKRYRSQLLRA